MDISDFDELEKNASEVILLSVVLFTTSYAHREVFTGLLFVIVLS